MACPAERLGNIPAGRGKRNKYLWSIGEGPIIPGRRAGSGRCKTALPRSTHFPSSWSSLMERRSFPVSTRRLSLETAARPGAPVPFPGTTSAAQIFTVFPFKDQIHFDLLK